jgi:hypothetical protein
VPVTTGWPRGLAPYEPIAPGFMRRVSWGAIIAGMIVALVVELALSTLGLAIGLGSINPATEPQPFAGIGAGTGIWLAITTFAALFCGGLTAGRLAGLPRKADGVMHGIVTWGLVTLLSAWMVTSAVGQLVSGAVGVVGAGLGAVGQGIGAVAPQALGAAGAQLGLTQANVQAEVERFLRQTGDPALQPEALQRQAAQAGTAVERAAGQAAQRPQNGLVELDTVFGRLWTQAGGVINQLDRQDAINVVKARTGKSDAEAAQIVDNWIATLQKVPGQLGQAAQQAGQTAAHVTEQVTGALGQAAAWAFVAMVLGVIAAALGGSVGTPQEVPAVAAPVSTGVTREH